MGASLKFGKIVLLFIAIVTLSASCFAGAITLQNPGFDTDTTGSFITGTLTGWTPNTTEYGVWNTTSSAIALAPLSVGNVLFLSTVAGTNGMLDGSASQTTADAVIPDGTYTFSIYASKRNDLVGPIAFELQMYAGTGSAFAVQNFQATALSSSSWQQFSVTGVAPSNATGNLGVRVTLVSAGMSMPGTINPDANKYQVLFDDAGALGPDASGVPEPMTMSLIGSGLAGVALLRRRK